MKIMFLHERDDLICSSSGIFINISGIFFFFLFTTLILYSSWNHWYLIYISYLTVMLGFVLVFSFLFLTWCLFCAVSPFLLNISCPPFYSSIFNWSEVVFIAFISISLHFLPLNVTFQFLLISPCFSRYRALFFDMAYVCFLFSCFFFFRLIQFHRI